MLLFQSSFSSTIIPSSTSILIILLIMMTLLTNQFSLALQEGKCEVCIGVLNKLITRLDSSEKSNPKLIEERFREFCLDTKKAENRFCYYIGGLEESATKILGEMSKPLSWGMPAEKICEKLMKKDQQICELRYEKTIDLKTVDLKKLKVKDLKKILSDWDERCDGCIEKTEFIARIEKLKSKYMQQQDSQQQPKEDL